MPHAVNSRPLASTPDTSKLEKGALESELLQDFSAPFLQSSHSCLVYSDAFIASVQLAGSSECMNSLVLDDPPNSTYSRLATMPARSFYLGLWPSPPPPVSHPPRDASEDGGICSEGVEAQEPYSPHIPRELCVRSWVLVRARRLISSSTKKRWKTLF